MRTKRKAAREIATRQKKANARLAQKSALARAARNKNASMCWKLVAKWGAKVSEL